MNPFWSVTLFWIAAAASVAIALAFVLPPLLRREQAAAKAARRDINIAVYRDQLKEMEADRDNGLLSEEQFQSGKIELEARLAEDALLQDERALTRPGSRKLGFTLAGLLPVAAFGLYFVLGNPMSLTAIAEASANPGMAGMPGQHDILKMIQQVEERTKANPDDGAAWALLAKTYAVVEHWPEALHAYEKAIALQPEVASVMSGYAEALAVKNGRVLQGKPMELILKALERDPDDMKALELAGISHFQEREFARAAYYFKRLLKLLPPDSPYAQDIAEAQKEANRLAHGNLTGMDNLSDLGAQPDAATEGGGRIHGTVDIAPALKNKLGASDAIFLFARPSEGGMPLAALRATGKTLPLEFELTDAMAMNPDARLSRFKEVMLVARVSKSGDVKPMAGDLEGVAVNVKVGSENVKVMIDKVRPD